MSKAIGSLPSFKRDRKLEHLRTDAGRTNGLRRRLLIYAGLIVLGVVVAAYVDGGEEPLHPIVQEVMLPTENGGAG
ncbi:MAG: hypothetical protein AAGK17_10290 [Pseudomonadota bacterium]